MPRQFISLEPYRAQLEQWVIEEKIPTPRVAQLLQEHYGVSVKDRTLRARLQEMDFGRLQQVESERDRLIKAHIVDMFNSHLRDDKIAEILELKGLRPINTRRVGYIRRAAGFKASIPRKYWEGMQPSLLVQHSTESAVS